MDGMRWMEGMDEWMGWVDGLDEWMECCVNPLVLSVADSLVCTCTSTIGSTQQPDR